MKTFRHRLDFKNHRKRHKKRHKNFTHKCRYSGCRRRYADLISLDEHERRRNHGFVTHELILKTAVVKIERCDVGGYEQFGVRTEREQKRPQKGETNEDHRGVVVKVEVESDEEPKIVEKRAEMMTKDCNNNEHHHKPTNDPKIPQNQSKIVSLSRDPKSINSSIPISPQIQPQKDKNNNKNSILHKMFTKIYDCSKCDLQFTSLGPLVNHEKHHDGFKYQCHICGMKYSTRSNLKEHLRKTHGVEVMMTGVKRKKNKSGASCENKKDENEKKVNGVEKINLNAQKMNSNGGKLDSSVEKNNSNNEKLNSQAENVIGLKDKNDKNDKSDKNEADRASTTEQKDESKANQADKYHSKKLNQEDKKMKDEKRPNDAVFMWNMHFKKGTLIK
jgi:hypothetical protein